jgi:hypothetical protein
MFPLSPIVPPKSLSIYTYCKSGMLPFLIDYNLTGDAVLLYSSDRVVWQFAQTNQMILITANRNMKGDDSLEQTIREDNTPTSLPILTIGNPDRFGYHGF